MNSLNPLLGGTGTSNYSLDQILQSTQPQPQPSTFRKVLGGLVGGVGNLVAPGVGSLIGKAISGGNNSNLSSALGGLDPQSIMADSFKYIQLQQQMSVMQEQYEAISSVIKSRHDSSMAAIRNIS